MRQYTTAYGDDEGLRSPFELSDDPIVMLAVGRDLSNDRDTNPHPQSW